MPTQSSRIVAGRYRLVRELGSGGMGTVWLAADQLLDREVAIKEVSPPLDVTEPERAVLRERTLREARTAARLSHPNVVTIYDVVEDGGRPWIVMELVAARSLRDIVAQDGPLTPQRAAEVGRQLLAALGAASCRRTNRSARVPGRGSPGQSSRSGQSRSCRSRSQGSRYSRSRRSRSNPNWHSRSRRGRTSRSRRWPGNRGWLRSRRKRGPANWFRKRKSYPYRLPSRSPGQKPEPGPDAGPSPRPRPPRRAGRPAAEPRPCPDRGLPRQPTPDRRPGPGRSP